MRTRLLVAGVLLVVGVFAGPGSWGADAGRYGMPVQVTAYDVTVTPDFDANTCRVVAECRLRNFGSAPAATASFYLLTQEAAGTSIAGMVFHVRGAAGAWVKAASTTAEVPLASWMPAKATVYTVALPQSLPPQAETALRATYTLVTTDPATSDLMPPLPAGRRELVLVADHVWLPTPPASDLYAFSRYGRDKYDIRYKPTWTIRVHAPTGYRAVAISGEATGENSWRSRVPGDLLLFVGRYQLTTVEDSGLALDIYTPPGTADTETILAPAREMARYYRVYTEAFGPLRGTRLNFLFTAHPNFVGHAGYLGFAVGDAMRYGAGELDHELAHSWWGLSVSAYGVGTEFLDESLAEWSAAWARGKVHGGILPGLAPRNRWRQFALVQGSFVAGTEFGGQRTWPRMSSPVLVDLDPYGDTGDRAASYTQSTGLLTEVMDTVGEAAFLKALRTYAETRQGDSCTLDDFVASLWESTGRDFGPFLRERSAATRVDTRLHSFYVASDLHSSRKGSGWQTEVTVLNKGTHETVCPIELRAAGGKVQRTLQVPPGEVRKFTFTTDAQVESLTIDPRWEPLPVVGESVWRGINLPSDDPWELARRMTPDGMGGENWAWYVHALAFARIGQWQTCVDAITEYDSRAKRPPDPGYSFLSSIPVYAYLRGTAFLHLGEADLAAHDLVCAIDDLVEGLEGREVRGQSETGMDPLDSFGEGGLISDVHDLVSVSHLLKLLTGQGFGFDPKADRATNAPAVARWKAWWKGHRSGYQVPEALRQHPELLPLQAT
jgi:hypothetical protein